MRKSARVRDRLDGPFVDGAEFLRMLNLFKRCVGSAIERLPVAMKMAAVDAALWHLERITYQRLRARGFIPGTIIDIGAHTGEWTKTIKTIFPETPVLMIEARQEAETDLAQVSGCYKDVSYKMALLGASNRECVPFHVQGTGSSIYPERSDEPSSLRVIEMTTLDNVVGNMRPPFLQKLDVQGAELDVLRGASRTLQNTEIIQLEVPLLSYNDGAPELGQIIIFMNERGFAPYEIAGLVRPFNSHLVQIDMIFVRATSKLRPQRFHFHSRLPD